MLGIQHVLGDLRPRYPRPTFFTPLTAGEVGVSCCKACLQVILASSLVKHLCYGQILGWRLWKPQDVRAQPYCGTEGFLLLLPSSKDLFPKTCSAPRYLGRVQLHQGSWPKSFHSNREGRLGERRACSPEGEPVGVNLLAVISFLRVSRLHSSPGCKRLLPSLGKAAQPRYQGLSQRGGIRDDFLPGFASWRFLIFCSEHDIWAIK